jgi:hypothetical protein
MSRPKSAFVFLLVLWLLLVSSTPSFATKFAILLNGCDTNGNGSCGDDDKLEVKNPLYQESGNKGENPLFEAKADLIIVNPPDLTSGSPVELHFAFGSSISVSVPPVPGGALVFELDIVDPATGNKLTNFPNLVDISFSVPELAHRHNEGIVHRDLAFRYLNTSVNPAVWQTQSAVTSKDGNFCGNTDHFSIFAFGAVPEPSSAILIFASSLGLLWRRSSFTA